MDLTTTYEAIRISSGNSFVHETESQVILNGSRDISFTMDLVLKDIGLFQAIADRAGVPLELNPLMIDIFDDGAGALRRTANGPQHHPPARGRDRAVDPRARFPGRDDRRRARSSAGAEVMVRRS